MKNFTESITGNKIETLMNYKIYTDGAYSSSHQEGAFAYVMLDSQGNIVRKLSKKITEETNNRAEVKAILAGIYHLPEDAVTVTIISDSQYALNTLFNGWSRNANADLFKIADDILEKKKNVKIEYQWVKGHSGDPYNEMCDQMCTEVLGYDPAEEYAKYKKK